ncbi:MAG: 3-hydroxyacyl-[acyl-carrier-protein] dehydratase FabZ [Planctomycetia bacterium]|nr:3-hydroxyacyl-[acyl-carrier-protein] dehydratase FabZ [Planctomycetia bacterium]
MTETSDAKHDAALANLPHAEPFRFLDRIDELSPERARGAWIVKGDEDFLRGHFPGRPLVPGVLITEAAAQLAGAAAHHAMTETETENQNENEKQSEGSSGMLVLSEARFRRPVEPPASIELVVDAIGRFGSIHRFDFEATVEGVPVASGSVGVSLTPAGGEAAS